MKQEFLCIIFSHKNRRTMSLQKQFLKSNKACKVTFCLPEAVTNGAKEVKILGDFNNWEKENGIPMKVKNGEFVATVQLDAGKEYQFRYLLDNKTWENDGAADGYTATPFGVENSVVATFPPAK
jgi:1,4-alpha-glucan branching enzyme